MDTLLNIWYMVSGLIGIVLVIGGILSFVIITPLILFGISDAIKYREYSEIPMVIGLAILCVIFIATSSYVNINIPKEQKQISTEINNIVSYEGIANVKEGKYNYDYLYFTQGTNNNYTVLKLNPDKCKIHYTDQEEIKVVENHTEYTSQFRYLALFSLDDNLYYDVYLPQKFK